MAYAYLTALDLAKINGNDAVVGLIEESLNSAPEVQMFPARTIAGTSYRTLQRVTFPQPSFRAINAGVEPVKSTYANKLVECFYLDGQLEMDVAAARMDEQGEAHALALEADGITRGALTKIGSQIWYGTGTGGDVLGFPGAVQTVDSSLVYDASGTTADTGSSVYGVKMGEKFCNLIFGLGNVLTLGEWRQQTITRSSKELTAWKNSIEGWVGVQWVNKYAVGRIKKITADSGKTLTDLMIATWLSQFPIGMAPDVLFMNRRSALQLQTSRTMTVNVDGGGKTSGTAGRAVQLISAPMPTESNGIPIVVTDSILSTESLTL